MKKKLHKKEDASLQEAKSFACDWCGQPATHKDWREIDGMTTSTLECGRCANLDTAFLIERQAKRSGKRQTGETPCDLCYEGNCPHACHGRHMDE